MAEGSTHWYQKGKANVYKGEFGDFRTAVFQAVLLTSSYTPNQQTDEHWSDISAYEASGTGYTAGGVTVTNLSVSDSSLVITINFDNPEWAPSTITARYCAIVKKAGASLASTDHLLCYIDFGTNQSSSGTDFTITLDTTGILTDTVS